MKNKIKAAERDSLTV